ncbi:MAG: FMN-dependent NADH-azoreductase [Cyanothece sp. SIO1E1]|nr:FMN-dependent NADH-azoreductase [Cyanothece sp. SIO1E1]
MTSILHLDASPRGDRSVSRQLSQAFMTNWQSRYPDDNITYRDLGHTPVPHVNEAGITAAFTPPEARTPDLVEAIQVSDALVDEFLAADRYIFGIPMYNFNVPSTFKAYIDQIVRPGRTFAMDEQRHYTGLVPAGKKMLVITARGGSYALDDPAAEPDHYQEPFLRSIFGFIGITDITFIHAERLAWGEEARQQSLVAAHTAIKEVAAKW